MSSKKLYSKWKCDISKVSVEVAQQNDHMLPKAGELSC